MSNKSNNGDMRSIKALKAKVETGLPLSENELKYVRAEILRNEAIEATSSRNVGLSYMDTDAAIEEGASAATRGAELKDLLEMHRNVRKIKGQRDQFIAACLRNPVLSLGECKALIAYIPALEYEANDLEIKGQVPDGYIEHAAKSKLANLRKRAKKTRDKIKDIQAKVEYSKMMAAQKAKAKAGAEAETKTEAKAEAPVGLSPDEQFAAEKAAFRAQIEAAEGRLVKSKTSKNIFLVLPLNPRTIAILDDEKVRRAGSNICEDESDCPTVHMGEQANFAIPISEIKNWGGMLHVEYWNWEMYDLVEKLLDLEYWPKNKADEDTDSVSTDVDEVTDAVDHVVDHVGDNGACANPNPTNKAAVAIVADAISASATDLDALKREKQRAKNQARRKGGKGRGARRKGNKQTGGSKTSTAANVGGIKINQ